MDTDNGETPVELTDEDKKKLDDLDDAWAKFQVQLTDASKVIKGCW